MDAPAHPARLEIALLMRKVSFADKAMYNASTPGEWRSW